MIVGGSLSKKRGGGYAGNRGVNYICKFCHGCMASHTNEPVVEYEMPKLLP